MNTDSRLNAKPDPRVCTRLSKNGLAPARSVGARRSGSHRNGGVRGCRGQALQHYSCTPLLCFR
ncbi:hypothetical protein T492DRAFT_1064960, partial [Pavlovales sp. CCMP2436]